MTLHIDFTPQETAWLNAQAEQQGLAPAEVIRKMVDAHLQNTEGAIPTAEPPSVVDADSAAAIAQLKAWMKDDATEDPEEIRRSVDEYEELKRNLNANRAANDERLVFP